MPGKHFSFLADLSWLVIVPDGWNPITKLSKDDKTKAFVAYPMFVSSLQDYKIVCSFLLVLNEQASFSFCEHYFLTDRPTAELKPLITLLFLSLFLKIKRLKTRIITPELPEVAFLISFVRYFQIY